MTEVLEQGAKEGAVAMIVKRKQMEGRIKSCVWRASIGQDHAGFLLIERFWLENDVGVTLGEWSMKAERFRKWSDVRIELEGHASQLGQLLP